MNRVKVFAAVCSIIIHLLLAFILYFDIKTQREKLPAYQFQQGGAVTLLPPVENEPILIAKQEEEGNGHDYFSVDNCAADRQYDGIGIIFDPYDFKITEAPTSYPAYRAGIRVGDVIMRPYSTIAVQGVMDVDIEKPNGKVVKYRIKTTRICYRG